MKINYIGKCLLIENGKRVLVIGDLHLGYVDGMRKNGVLVPGNLFKDVVRELDLVFDFVGRVDEVVLLGDVKHEFAGISEGEWREVKGLLDYLNGKCNNIIIVKGNHDKITNVVSEKKGIKIVDYYIQGVVAFVHGDRDFPKINGEDVKYWVMGHGHPAVRITDGVKEEKYKCFLSGSWKGKKVIIVPSFFDVNSGTDARDYDLGMAWDFKLGGFNVMIVGEKLEVLNFGKLGKL